MSAAAPDALHAALVGKLQAGRPVAFSPPEAALLSEALREAIATTLSVPPAQVEDDARLFDALGLDSIDVFDVLDQLSQRFEVTVALEELPESLLRGDGETTFRAFADGLLDHFRQAPVQAGTAVPSSDA